MITLSKAQKALLDSSSHLLAVSCLDDNDLLVLDLGKPQTESWNNGHYGPYVLTVNGDLQDVNYHYAHYHGKQCPFFLV